MEKIKVLNNGNVRVTVPVEFKYIARRRRLIAPDILESPPDPIALCIARAYYWQSLIDRKEYANSRELAEALKFDPSYVSRTLRLVLLAPEIVRAALAGTLPESITLTTLLHLNEVDWKKQMQTIGLK